MNRDEFLTQAKARACAYIDGPQPHLALSSLISDLSNHPDLANQLAVVMELGVPLAANGHLSDRAALRKFIDDFS